MFPDYYDSIAKVAETDKEVADAMALELKRQRENIELIASENLVSPQVMAAMGSVLTNKYAEGFPGKRYYGGCQYVDVVEEIAIKRACELFGAKYANVQAHSGAQANIAAYFAVIKPGDTVMGMSLDNGGHLTHGSPVMIWTLSQSRLTRLSQGLLLQALPLTRERLILKQWLILLTQTALCLWLIWHISQVLLLQGFIKIRFLMQILLQPQRIKL